jgi:hypothetical protein
MEGRAPRALATTRVYLLGVQGSALQAAATPNKSKQKETKGIRFSEKSESLVITYL